MRTKEQIEKAAKSINATFTAFDTGEKWIDEKGSTYNINRAPIDWKRVMNNSRREKNDKTRAN